MDEMTQEAYETSKKEAVPSVILGVVDNLGSAVGSGLNNNVTFDSQPTLWGSANPGDTVVVFRAEGDKKVYVGEADMSGNWTLKLGDSLADGVAIFNTFSASHPDVYADRSFSLTVNTSVVSPSAVNVLPYAESNSAEAVVNTDSESVADESLTATYDFETLSTGVSTTPIENNGITFKEIYWWWYQTNVVELEGSKVGLAQGVGIIDVEWPEGASSVSLNMWSQNPSADGVVSIKYYLDGQVVGKSTLENMPVDKSNSLVTLELPYGKFDSVRISFGNNAFYVDNINAVEGGAPINPTIVDVVETLDTSTAHIASGGSTEDKTPYINGKAQADHTVLIKNGDTVIGSVVADADGNWGFEPELTYGPYKLYVVSVNQYGQQSAASEQFILNVSEPAPAEPAMYDFETFNTGANSTPVEHNGITFKDVFWWWYQTNVVEVDGSKVGLAQNYGIIDIGWPEGATSVSLNMWSKDPTSSGTVNIKYYLDGKVVGESTLASMPADRSNSLVTLGLPYGKFDSVKISYANNAFYVDNINAVAGALINPTIEAVFETLDTSATDIVSGGSTEDQTPHITGKAQANSTVFIKNGDVVIGSVTADADGNWSYEPELAYGSYTLSVVSIGQDGRQSAISQNFNLDVSKYVHVEPAMYDFESFNTGVNDSIPIEHNGITFKELYFWWYQTSVVEVEGSKVGLAHGIGIIDFDWPEGVSSVSLNMWSKNKSVNGTATIKYYLDGSVVAEGVLDSMPVDKNNSLVTLGLPTGKFDSVRIEYGSNVFYVDNINAVRAEAQAPTVMESALIEQHDDAIIMAAAQAETEQHTDIESTSLQISAAELLVGVEPNVYANDSVLLDSSEKRVELSDLMDESAEMVGMSLQIQGEESFVYSANEILTQSGLEVESNYYA